MSRFFSLLVAWRYLFSRRSRRLLHVVSIITIIGVSFGVASLLITLGVVSGFREEYERSVLAFNAHIVVMSAEEIRDIEALLQKIRGVARPGELTGLVPFLYREGLAIQGTAVRGLAVKGVGPLPAVDMENYWKLSGLPHQSFEGTHGLWIGKILWEGLGKPQGKLRLHFPGGTRSSGLSPFQEFPIAGTFSAGLYDYDASFALVSLEMARRVLGPGITGVEIWLTDPRGGAENFGARLSETLSFPYTVLTWRDLNANLFHALNLERLVFVIIMGLLILVASFNIMGSLSMRVLEKRGDIAIFRAMGARWAQIRRTFFLQGIILSGIGGGIGILLAWLVLTILGGYRPLALAPEVYFLDHLPVRWEPGPAGIVLAVTLGFSWLASRVALFRLKRLSVVGALGEVGS